jgi:hypothetical protein
MDTKPLWFRYKGSGRITAGEPTATDPEVLGTQKILTF